MLATYQVILYHRFSVALGFSKGNQRKLSPKSGIVSTGLQSKECGRREFVSGCGILGGKPE